MATFSLSQFLSYISYSLSYYFTPKIFAIGYSGKTEKVVKLKAQLRLVANFRQITACTVPTLPCKNAKKFR